MIQRVQTLYLILISSLMMCMLFLPYANLGNEVATYTWGAEGISTVGDTPELIEPIWTIFTLVVISMILPLVTIALYKKRLLQVRFCIFNGIILVAFYLVFAYYWWMIKDELEVITSFSGYLLMPLAAIVLDIISAKKILQDEILVRSVDRIR